MEAKKFFIHGEFDTECVLIGRFQEDRKNVDGKLEVANWVDKEKGIAKGKYIIDQTRFLVNHINEYGNMTGELRTVYVSRKNIIKVYEEIMAIEAQEAQDFIPDELPF